MKAKAECVAVLLAGEEKRLDVLTKNREKAMLPFGGKYRMIDFALSSCAHSGFDTIGILPQEEPLALSEYINDSGLQSSVHILPCNEKTNRQYINFVDRYHADYVLVLEYNQIYKMDFSKLLSFHKEKNADCTVVTYNIPPEKATEYCVIDLWQDGFVTGFEEKSRRPKSTRAFMGIYLFNWKTLKKYLEHETWGMMSQNNFGKNVVSLMLSAGEKIASYLFDGCHWEVNSGEGLWTANMELLEGKEKLNLFDAGWRISTENKVDTPSCFGENARVFCSIVADSCVIDGTVSSSVIFSGVTISKGAVVKDSVVFKGSMIGRGTVINKSIIGEGVLIGDNATIGRKQGEEALFTPKITIVGDRVQIGKNAEVQGEIAEDIPEKYIKVFS